MYYQFDSRLNLPAIMFDDDRIVAAGKEYFYTDLKDVEISKAPLLATYGIMELKTAEKSIPVPFAKADIHRLRTAIQEAKHLIRTYAQRKVPEEAAGLQSEGEKAAADKTAGHLSEGAETAVDKTAVISSEAAETAAQAFYSQTRQNYALDPYEEMKKLKELLDLDIITQEEFARKKKELLGL